MENKNWILKNIAYLDDKNEIQVSEKYRYEYENEPSLDEPSFTNEIDFRKLGNLQDTLIQELKNSDFILEFFDFDDAYCADSIVNLDAVFYKEIGNKSYTIIIHSISLKMANDLFKYELKSDHLINNWFIPFYKNLYAYAFVYNNLTNEIKSYLENLK